MKTANSNLHKAKNAKKDEFYTQLSDIEQEVFNYKAHFKDQIVYCNCDDPLQSAFFEYFFKNFKFFGLKGLITTCYKSQNFRDYTKEESPKKAYAIKIYRDDLIKGDPIDPQKHEIEDVEDELTSQLAKTKSSKDPKAKEAKKAKKENIISLSQAEEALNLSLSCSSKQSPKTIENFKANRNNLMTFTEPLDADLPKNILPLYEDDEANNAGDFRSKACVELLKKADIVVTNPPFSLFREYVAQLIEFDKKFLIIGNKNAITYKEIFKHIKEGKLWLGYGFKKGNAYFQINKESEQNFANGVYDATTGLVKFRNVTWFTNLTHKKRTEILETIYSYTKNPEKYPKYDNYDAINVDKTGEIPLDYEGIMGVPITFLDKHNPRQFEIVGNEYDLKIDKGRGYVNGKRMYSRIFIRKIAEVEELKAKQEQEEEAREKAKKEALKAQK